MQYSLLSIYLILFIVIYCPFAIAFEAGDRLPQQMPATEIIVKLNRTEQLSANTNHGEKPVGVIGFAIDKTTGRVLIVYPESNLKQYDVQAGDYVIAINDLPYSFSTFRSEGPGDVGQPIKLTFNRNGLTKDIVVKRIDARIMAQHNDYDDYFARCAANTKYW